MVPGGVAAFFKDRSPFFGLSIDSMNRFRSVWLRIRTGCRLYLFLPCFLFFGLDTLCPLHAMSAVEFTAEECRWLVENPGKLIPFFDTEFPPIEYISEPGIFTGMGSEVITLIEDCLGVSFVKYPCRDSNRHLAGLESGGGAMAPTIVRTAERERYALFPIPYASVPAVITASDIRTALVRIPAGALDAVRQSWFALEAHSGLSPEALRLIAWAAVFTGLLLSSLVVITVLLKRRLTRNVVGLQESERKYRELVENANSIIIRMDAGCRVTFFNEFAQRFFGYSEKEILGRHLVGTIVPPTDSMGRDLAAMMDRLARDPEEYANSESENMRRSGERAWIAWANRPVLDENGRLKEVLSVGSDITARKRAEEALQESESRFRFLTENMADIVWTIDLNFRTTYTSPSIERILGFTPNERRNQPIEAVMPPESLQTVSRLFEEEFRKAALSPGDPNRSVTAEVQYFRKDGTLAWLENTMKWIRGEDGEVEGILGVSRDISERRQAELEREKLQAQFQQAQKMEAVGRLAGGVAHDFNNMLGVIIGHAELTLARMDHAVPYYNNLIEIEKAAKRSAELTRQLLTFARRQTIAPRVLDLNETVEGMLQMLRRLIGENIHLVWVPGSQVWPVRVDPSQVDQILANLCVNARDAIAGDGKIVIETNSAQIDEAYYAFHPDFSPGEYVRLILSDDGCGMDSATLDNLFEPFFTTKELSKGTGLGLATVYGIVRQNDGFIDVSSELGKGSTFTIYLPRYKGACPDARQDLPLEIAEGGRETVLLVEDEAAILDLTKTMLKNLGYDVLAANSPDVAIRLAETQTKGMDLLITDVVMPGMNGRDLAENLSRIRPGIRRLFMSGYTADVIAQHGVLDDGVHFIQKPFTLKELDDCIKRALNSGGQ